MVDNGAVTARHLIAAAATAVVAPRSRRGLAYLLLALPLDLLGAVVLVVGCLLGAILLITPLGAWLLAGMLRMADALGRRRRDLVARLLDERVPAPTRSTAGPGAFGWRRAVLADPVGWRALAYAVTKVPVAVIALAVGAGGYVYGLVALTYLPWPVLRFGSGTALLTVLVSGLILLLLAPWMLRLVLAGERRLVRGLLGPSRTNRRMTDLRESRDQAVNDADTTLRRIERDLHDGAQARLIGVGMYLAMVRELVAAQAPQQRIKEAVDTAQDNLDTAVAELRNLVRGIHPPVLDRGLETALATVAAGSAVLVTIDADLPRRPPPAVESIVYFSACELLTNANRHSGATEVTMRITLQDDVLRLRVRDDGRGGAHARVGGGLAGLAERVRVVDGRLVVDSPPGGPTAVTLDVPCPAPTERP